MTGTGEFSVADSGSTAKGEVVMKTQSMGMTIDMTMVSKGQRIGDC